MVCAASREIRNYDIVFLGIGLPVVAGLLAQRTHAPDAQLLFESGVVGAKPSRSALTMGDPALASGAAMITDFYDLFALFLQRGLIDVGFLGAAQIDKRGNLNTTVVGRYQSPTVRLPGSGGACEVAALSERLIVIMRQEKRRFVEKVDFVTSAGFPNGRNRVKDGLRGGGPDVVISTMGVYRFDEEGEMYLDTYHPSFTIDQIKEDTGWKLRVSSKIRPTPPPTREEVKLLREEIDPHGLFLRGRAE